MALLYQLKKTFFFFFLLFSPYHYTQVKASISFIDSLQIKEYGKLMEIGDYKGITLQEQKLINLSKKIHYTKGEIMGCLNLANALCAMNNHKESLYFLNIADKKLAVYDDVWLKARLHHLYGRNYHYLGLHQQAIKTFDRSLQFAYKIKDKKEKESRIYNIYDWKRASFSNLNMMDSVYSNERKCMRSPKPMLYITIAQRHLKTRNIDSAEYYVNKANALVVDNKSTIEGKANVLRAFGELYIAKKEYQKALDSLLKSLAITQKMDRKRRNLEAYKFIAQGYKNLNNFQKENEYLVKYSILSDSLSQADKSILNIPIEKFLDEQAENEAENRKYLYYMIIGIILIGIAIIVIILNLYKRNQRQKDILIDEKEKEADSLKKKLDTVYEEVVQLAVNGDPLFITKFKETYSEFYNNLAMQCPNLTTNDLRFCALVKLNFSNKEIAQYDNISIRTVESKKYRLRKKIGLSADVDFNTWIMEQ